MSRLNPVVAMALTIYLSTPLQAVPHPWAHLSLHEQADAIQTAISQLQTKDHDKIIAFSELLYQIGETLAVDSISAFAIRRRAWAYYQKQDLAKSTRNCLALEQRYRQLNDVAGLGTAYFDIGKLFSRAHAYEEAIRYYTLARTHYEAAYQDAKVSLVLYQMGQAYLDLDRPEMASHVLREAFELCPEDKKAQRSMIYNLQGRAVKDQGNYEPARQFYRRSLRLWKESNPSAKRQAIAANNIGESYLLEECYDSASWYLEKALALKATLKDPESSLATMVLLADMNYRRGRHKEAIALLKRGIKTIDPTHLTKAANDALALAMDITQDHSQDVSWTTPLLSRSIQRQREQFLALQARKAALYKFSIKAGEDLYAQEMESRQLQASLLNQRYQKNQWSTASIILLCVALFGFIYAHIQKRQKIQTEMDKNTFVNQQMKNYDQRILQMLIVKAEYEEIKRRLKRDFGLGDPDLPSDIDR